MKKKRVTYTSNSFSNIIISYKHIYKKVFFSKYKIKIYGFLFYILFLNSHVKIY